MPFRVNPRRVPPAVGPGVVVTRLARVVWPFQAAVFAVHRAGLRASGGRVGRSLAGRPVLLLETTGRRTGRVRVAPLIYVRDGNAFAVAGSFAGRDVDPAWVANLRADPRAHVVLDGRRLRVLARPAGSAEHPRLWAALDRVNGGQYSRYQAITPRRIPVVILERAGRVAVGDEPVGDEPVGREPAGREPLAP